MVNLVGNHDIGYGNEIVDWRLNRWEKAFGETNREIVFGDHLLAVIDSLQLDGSINRVCIKQNKYPYKIP